MSGIDRGLWNSERKRRKHFRAVLFLPFRVHASNCEFDSFFDRLLDQIEVEGCFFLLDLFG